MEHPLKILLGPPRAGFLALASILALSACEKTDMGGMFLSEFSVNERFEQSVEWNASHPYREILVPSDDYSILSMSDSHVGGTVNLDAFLNRAIADNAAAVVMVGDLCTGHAEDYRVFEQHIPLQDSLPSFQIVGNHDLFFDGWSQFRSRFGSSTYFFSIRTPEASDLYICLDTGGGTLGSSQLDWLRDVLLSQRSAYRRCVVFTHNNLFRPRHTGSTNPLVEELHVLIELFASLRVDMVVTGHDHKHDAQTLGRTTYIQMDALVDGLSYAGYLQIQVINGEISYGFENF